MQNFTTALKAEHIKKKGTGVYILSIIIGALTPVIFSIVNLIEDIPDKRAIPFNYYTEFIKSCYDAFMMFFFPLLIIITVSRITQIDHKNGGWQLMETQPVKKISIYFSKFSVILIANLIAIFSFIITGYLCAWLLSFAHDIPEVAITSFQLGTLLLMVARMFIAALFLTALQYGISVLLPSFIWSVLIGFFMLLSYIFLNAFHIVPDWYPIEIMGKIAAFSNGSDLGYWFTYSEAVGLTCCLLALYIGFEWYKHKKLKAAFFGNGKRFAALLAVLIVSGGLLAYILHPNQMHPYNKTVIAGKIVGEQKIHAIYLTDNFIQDTIAVIPVNNDNTFRYVADKKIPLDNYSLTFDKYIQAQVVLSTNDSMYADVKMYKKGNDLKITGTRLAENQYNKKSTPYTSVEYYIGQNQFIDNPDFIINQLVKDWKDAMQRTNDFKTADNYVPRQDFIQKNKEVLTLFYLNLWNKFIKKRNALYPDKETKETADIQEMKRTVPLNDETMLSNEDYFNYLMDAMTEKDTTDTAENTKYIRAIAQLPKSAFKDKLMFHQLEKSIEEASDEKERDSLTLKYAGTFGNPRYTTIMLNKSKVINRLSKGMPAPSFDAATLDGKTVSLESLKGKYVLIDVWATWCGPCRYEAPYFEKFAIKYKNQPIQFVSASIDENMANWYVEAKSKSKSVLQLHINNKDAFSNAYAANSIPRFILIDPEGNFVNSDMPHPSSPAFEQLLRQALGLKEQK